MPASSSFLQSYLEPWVGRWLYADSGLWTVIGFLGAAIFGSRFVLQWLQTEKEKKLVVPWHFWHLSFWGSVLNLLYFMHLDKAPLILGNCFLPFLYGRNILFLRAGGEKGRGRLVFAAVAVLTVVGFAVSGFTSTPSKLPSKETLASTELMNADTAFRAFASEYGRFPVGDTRNVITALTGDNPKKIDFLNRKAHKFSATGEWLDPWGHPYRIFVFGRSVLIRCAGPNETFDDGNTEKRDDILLEFYLE